MMGSRHLKHPSPREKQSSLRQKVPDIGLDVCLQEKQVASLAVSKKIAGVMQDPRRNQKEISSLQIVHVFFNQKAAGSCLHIIKFKIGVTVKGGHDEVSIAAVALYVYFFNDFF